MNASVQLRMRRMVAGVATDPSVHDDGSAGEKLAKGGPIPI